MKKFFLLKRRSRAVEELIQQAISVLEKLKSRRRAKLAFLILLSNKSSGRIRVNSFTIYSMRQEEDGVVVGVMKACCQ
jgi:metal-responsive CopG/Arc/MetJ family transcriptional regulator